MKLRMVLSLFMVFVFAFSFGATAVAEKELDLDKIANSLPSATKSIVILQGTWYDMGVQYAKQSPDSLELQTAKALSEKTIAYGSVEAAFEAGQQVYETYQSSVSEILDFFKGMADGSGFSFEEIFVATARGCATTTATAKWCNASCAWGEATGGKVIAAINSDREVMEYNDPVMIIIPNDPSYQTSQHAVVTWRGLNSNGVMNDAGLCLALTGCAGSQENDWDNRALLPHIFRILIAVRCSTADEAKDMLVDHLENKPTSGVSTLIIDETSKGYCVESTNNEYAIREQNKSVEGDNDYMLFNNYFLSEKMDSHNVKDGTWDDCAYRFATVKSFLDRDYGSVSLDTLREAMASTTYVDIATGIMTAQTAWENSPMSYYSPENVAPIEKTLGRMIMDATDKAAYVLNGNENAVLSLIPEATGVYFRVFVANNPTEIVADARNYAYIYLYQAMRDISTAENVSEARMNNLNIAKRELMTGCNYLSLLGCEKDVDEVLAMQSKAATCFALAQSHAKMAWNDPHQIKCDYDEFGYIF